MIIVMKEHIHIFDTTLRDGEQCPGAAMNVEQKIQVAMQLETLGVDIIEAGFPVISDGDFRAVRAVAECTEKSRVCGLARCVEKDIIAAHEALKAAGERDIWWWLPPPSTGNTSWEKAGNKSGTWP